MEQILFYPHPNSEVPEGVLNFNPGQITHFQKSPNDKQVLLFISGFCYHVSYDELIPILQKWHPVPGESKGLRQTKGSVYRK